MGQQEIVVGISNTVHLLATVLWIGWSVLLAISVAPRAREAHLGEGVAAPWLTRAAPIGYGALAALGATGMIQMGAHPSYQGLFAVDSPWSALLLGKHLLVLASVGLILYLSQSVSPRLRLAARRERQGEPAAAAPLARRFARLARLNLVLGVAVLVVTGFMTAIR